MSMNLEIAMECLELYPRDYVNVTEPEISYQSRWSTCYSQVFENVVDGTYWKIHWSRGSTEYQDNGIQDVEFQRVFPKTKTITVYE